MTIYFLDLENGNDSNDGLSFANRVKKWSRTTELLMPGDELRVMASVGPQQLSVNGTWVNGSHKMTLSSPLNADICLSTSAWTPSANVTYSKFFTSSNPTLRDAPYLARLTVAAGFTTGLAAYITIPETDFSEYEQITFWLYVSAAVAAGQMSIRLCSDDFGAVPVDTLPLPIDIATAISFCTPVVINKGTTLGSAIRSIALYVETDIGAITYTLSGIATVKAAGSQDELHYHHFIGKPNSIGCSGDDTQLLYPIRAIHGTEVILDGAFSSTTPVKCANSSETAPAIKYTPVPVPVESVAADMAVRWIGFYDNRITVSGGWSRVDMSTNVGYTIFTQNVPTNQSVQLTWTGYHIDLSKISIGRLATTNVGLHESTVSNFHLIGTGSPSFAGIRTEYIGVTGAVAVATFNFSVLGEIEVLGEVGQFNVSGGGVLTVLTGSFTNVIPSGIAGNVIYDGHVYGIRDVATAGDAMTLTSAERTAVANEVESQIIDEADTEKVLLAITSKIAVAFSDLDDLSLVAIANAVATQITADHGAGSYVAAADTTVRDILEADRYIDLSVTPVQHVLIKKGTGTLVTGVRLLEQNLFTETGVPLPDINHFVGRSISP